jgi:hypothetical protein
MQDGVVIGTNGLAASGAWPAPQTNANTLVVGPVDPSPTIQCKHAPHAKGNEACCAHSSIEDAVIWKSNNESNKMMVTFPKWE